MPRPRLTAWFAALATLAVALVGAVVVGTGARAGTAAPTGNSPKGAVVLIGTGGLTWSEVSPEETPNLWTLLRDGSSAALTVRSVETNTCPVDGWLGLSAGARASAPRPGTERNAQDRPCPAIPDAVAGAIPTWDTYLQAARDAKFDSQLGLLAQTVGASGACLQAVGPGATLAAAAPSGRVAKSTGWDEATLLTTLAACPVSVVDVGSVRDPADLPAGEPTPDGPVSTQVTAIDQRIGQVIAAAPNGADFLVASLSDAGRTERLRLLVARGPHFGPGTLYSPATRQAGLAQSPDLTATVLDLVGLTTDVNLGGGVLESRAAADNSEGRAQDRLRALVDRDEASHEVHSLVEPFFTVFGYGQLVIYLFVLLVWKGRLGTPDRRLRMLRLVRIVAVSAACVPVSTFLANLLPWWRFPVPLLSVTASVGVFVVVLSYLALRGPWGRFAVGPLAAVSAVTAGVLALDVILGSQLQQSSLMGLQPVVAGRFYGMGNVTFALFATATILLCMAVASHFVLVGQRRTGAATVAILGAGALVIDGAPFWGADGGGPPALLPGLLVLLLAVLQVRLTWQRLVLIALLSAGLFCAVAFLDWLRPVGSRTHLGAFVQSVLDGTAGDIVLRKGRQNLRILTGNMPLTLLVPAALLFFFAVLARPTSWGSRALERSAERVPLLRSGLLGLLVTLTIGFLINDSGTAIPAVGATLAVPLVVAVVARTLEEEARVGAGTRSGRRRPSVSPGATPTGAAPATLSPREATSPATEPPAGGIPSTPTAPPPSSPAPDPGRTPPPAP